MANEKYILAVDLGTSGPRVVLSTIYGEVLDSETEEVKTQFLPNGGAEQDPRDWWGTFKSALHRLLEKTSVDPEKILCISVGGYFSTTVPVDQKGKPLMNALTWQDSRGGKHTRDLIGSLFFSNKKLRRSPIKVEGYDPLRIYNWIKYTGGAPGKSGTDSISHVLYIKNEHPKIYESTHKFLEPKDYLNFCMTGKFASTPDNIVLYWATDNRDISNIKYSAKMLRMVGLERQKLPDLIASTDILGPLTPQAAEELGLSSKTQVIGGGTDTSVAAIGAGAVKDYEPHLCIGTSSWIQCHIPNKKLDLSMSLGSFPSAVPGKYLILTENKTAGQCWKQLRDQILFPDGNAPADFFKYINVMGEKASPGSGKLIFTPWLSGERTPVENDTVRGGFFNWSMNTTRNDFVRSVFEGVAYNLKKVLECVEKFTKKKMDSINAIGGGCSSDLWCQILADVLNRRIHQVQNASIAGSRGAALIGAAALGEVELSEVGQYTKIQKTYEPIPENLGIYDELYGEFWNIYKRNQSVYARLNRTL